MSTPKAPDSHGAETVPRSMSTSPSNEKTPETSPPVEETNEIVYPTGITLALIIASLCLCVFLVALDQTIIAPALGAITKAYQSVGDIVSVPCSSFSS